VSIRRNKCLLCGTQLLPVKDDPRARQLHIDVSDCEVVYTDAWGVSIDGEAIAGLDATDRPDQDAPIVDDTGTINLNIFPVVEDVLQEIFDAQGVPRLGGASSGKGWTSYSIFQECPYKWKRRYIDDAKRQWGVESPGLAIGTLVHAFLALYYTSMIPDGYGGLTAESVYDRLRLRANPEFVAEAWRVFRAYVLYYQHEQITPLAVEHDLRDPRTGESCRYDLVAFFDSNLPGGYPSGTYIVESKTAGRFDLETTLDGWANDGEVIGQIMLWKRLGLDKRFGPLRGVIVNILGKQKEPKFHRTIVAPSSWQIEQHARDLERWDGLIALARSTDSFPRSRKSCIGRYGRCERWYECIGGEDA